MPAPYTKLQSDKGSVTTAGQAVQVNPVSTPCAELSLTANEGNTGELVYGGSNVVAASNGRIGTPLVQGQTVVLKIDDLSKVYVDAVNNGDGWSISWLS